MEGVYSGRAAVVQAWSSVAAATNRILCNGAADLFTDDDAGSRLLPCAGEADGSGVQPRLQVLLLPVEGGAVSGERLPDGGRSAGDLHPPTAGVAAGAGDACVAGRRADADGARVL